MNSAFLLLLTLAVSVAGAQASDPDPVRDAGDSPRNLQQIPQNRYDDAQDAANQLLNQSLGSVDKCYRGSHPWPDDDVAGRAIGALSKTVTAPGGLCDRWRQHAADLPIEVAVPLLPGVSLNTEKLCKVLQRPPCPR